MVLAFLDFLTSNNRYYFDIKRRDEVVYEREKVNWTELLMQDLENEMKQSGDNGADIAVAPGLVKERVGEQTEELDSELSIRAVTNVMLDKHITGDVVQSLSIGDGSAGESRILVLQTSTEQLHDNDPRVLSMTFPVLFPCGRGGIDEKRRVRTSFEYEICRWLNLWDRRFGSDPRFAAVAFNKIRREKAMKNLFHQVPESLRLDASFLGITSEQMKAALVWVDQCTRARMGGVRPPPPPQVSEVGHAVDFVDRIKRGNQNLPGTAEEMLTHRAKAYSLCYSEGEPHIMFTFTFNDVCNRRLQQWITLGQFLEMLPEKTRRYDNIDSDQGSSVLLFLDIVDVLFSEGLGFDIKTRRTKRRGGVFGPVRDLFYVYEVQGRGVLHVHVLVWLIGLPTRCADGRRAARTSFEARNGQTVKFS